MKFRILERDGGHEFVLQIKRKYWPFWYSARDYAKGLWYSIHPGTQHIYSYYYDSYNKARDCLDQLVQDKLEYEKRKKQKRVIRDEIDMDSEVDKFMESI